MVWALYGLRTKLVKRKQSELPADTIHGELSRDGSRGEDYRFAKPPMRRFGYARVCGACRLRALSH
jgi:hypothetical protein